MAITPTTQPKSKELVEIERLGFKYTEVAQFDLSNLSFDRRIQVREVGHYAPQATVDQYAVQMSYSVFPPIVVTRDNWIVDGNTRIGAALKKKDGFFPAIVLDADWGSGTGRQANDLYILAATLNQLGGLWLTQQETRVAVKAFIDRGFKVEQIARAIAVRPSTVGAVKKEIDAQAKLERVGIEPGSDFGPVSLRALGSKDAMALNDGPYAELAKLAVDAGLNMGEITAVAKDLREQGSDVKQVNRIQGIRQEMADRIRETDLTGKAKPPASRKLRQALGGVNKWEGQEHELVETNPEVASHHIEFIETAIKVLTSVLEAQKS